MKYEDAMNTLERHFHELREIEDEQMEDQMFPFSVECGEPAEYPDHKEPQFDEHGVMI